VDAPSQSWGFPARWSSRGPVPLCFSCVAGGFTPRTRRSILPSPFFNGATGFPSVNGRDLSSHGPQIFFSSLYLPFQMVIHFVLAVDSTWWVLLVLSFGAALRSLALCFSASPPFLPRSSPPWPAGAVKSSSTFTVDRNQSA